MARIAPRLGFPASDVEVLVGLVRNHLLLADTATLGVELDALIAQDGAQLTPFRTAGRGPRLRLSR